MTELFFKGKEFVYNHHLAVPHRPLVADAARSVGAPDLSGNLIVQGDNLHALKSLLPHYAGRVDCIFIDPPYNTGNEGWRYNDKVNAPMIKAWLDENPVGVEDGLRHDKWCAMMWPRLKLLRELLAEDGVIFICIDDNELHNLRSIMDEIFSEENFIGVLKRRAARKAANLVKKKAKHLCDYIVSYSKNELLSPIGLVGLGQGSRPVLQGNNNISTRTIKSGATANCPDGTYPDGKQLGHATEFTFENSFEIRDGILVADLEVTGRFRVNQDIISKTAFITRNLGIRRFVMEDEVDKVKVITDLVDNNQFYNEKGSELLQEIFNNVRMGETKRIFDTPKPLGLASFIFENFESDREEKDLIFLDSFAGSGTVAHAVLKANAEDGGNRKFIMVEMEEDIADSVTAERIRRVINGYSHGDKSTDGLGGTFTFCTLGEAIDLNRILSGETLPEYKTLAPVLFHMATNETLDVASIKPDKHYVGATEHEVVWMIYQSDLDWLKSDAAALTLSKAKEIAATDPNKAHLVFAPARFVSQKVLKEENLRVKFVPFPDALYQIERESE